MKALLFLAVLAGWSRTNWVGRKDENLIYRAPRKFVSGTINILSGPFEIFYQPIRLAGKEQDFGRQAAGVVVGIPVGLGYGVGRINGTWGLA
jgi:hypothetical protein